jgi:agmatinase
MADEITGQVDATRVPRFAGLPTFARLPTIAQVGRYDVAIVGVPFDSGVTYRPGARFGPSAIRTGSRLLRPFHPDMAVRPFDEQQVVDAGDIAVSPFHITEALDTVTSGIADHLETGARVLVLGGDHTVALPVLRAMAARHGPIGLIHFDAHLDTWDTYFGEPYTHGTPFRRAREEGLLGPAAFHVGIRNSVYGPADYEEDAALGFRIIGSESVGSLGVVEVAARIEAVLRDQPVYLSVDIDVLDPSHAPGTGTPEAGGLTSRELIGILRRLRGLRLVGGDIVEVAPAYDHAEITAIAAANVAYEILALFAGSRHG